MQLNAARPNQWTLHSSRLVAYGYQRSAASIRCHVDRQKRARQEIENGHVARNRCGVCGLPKKGHICRQQQKLQICSPVASFSSQPAVGIYSDTSHLEAIDATTAPEPVPEPQTPLPPASSPAPSLSPATGGAYPPVSIADLMFSSTIGSCRRGPSVAAPPKPKPAKKRGRAGSAPSGAPRAVAARPRFSAGQRVRCIKVGDPREGAVGTVVTLDPGGALVRFEDGGIDGLKYTSLEATAPPLPTPAPVLPALTRTRSATRLEADTRSRSSDTRLDAVATTSAAAAEPPTLVANATSDVAPFLADAPGPHAGRPPPMSRANSLEFDNAEEILYSLLA